MLGTLPPTYRLRATFLVAVLTAASFSGLLLAAEARADSISVIATNYLPARSSACAVSDANYAYTFGGYTGSAISTISRYSFSGNDWTNPANLPTVRYIVACAVIGGHAYTFGGTGDSTGGSRIIYKYTPGAGVSQMTDLPNGHYGASAVSTGSVAYVFGGRCDGCGGYLTSIVRFDPVANSATAVASLPASRAYTRAVWDGTHAYVIGGAESGGTYVNTILRFNPADNTVQTMAATLPSARVEATSVYDGFGSIYIFGGYASSMANDVLRYDIASDTLTTLPFTIPNYQYTAHAAWNPANAAAYLFGGYDSNFNLRSDVTKFAVTPKEPRNPAASRGPLAGQIGLTWQAPSGLPPTGYNIYRGTTSGGEGNTPIATITATSYTDTGLTAGQRYFYLIKAYNVNGNSNPSGEVNAKAPEAPAAPTTFSAATGTGVGQINLAWTAPTDTGGITLSGYNVHRGATADSTTLYQALGMVTAFTDTGLPNGAQRCYRVAGVNGVGEGILSPVVCAKAPDIPGAPGALNTTRGPGAGQVTLTWAAPTDTGGVAISGYKVYRSLTPGGGPENGFPVSASGTTHTDTGLPNGAVRYYRVAALNLVGEGPKGNETRGQAPELPTAPVQPSAIPDASSSLAIRVTWSKPTDTGGVAISKYTVYRSTVLGGPGVALDPGTGTSFLDRTRIPGVRYYYRVSATNVVGEGPASGTVSARGSTLPPGVDSDGDLLASAVEQRACNTAAVANLMDLMSPVLGDCVAAGDWEAFEGFDADNDWMLDATEPVLCSLQDDSDPADGTCVGAGDYGLPPEL